MRLMPILLTGFSLVFTASLPADEPAVFSEAKTQERSDNLLALAREVNRNAYADLQSFICHQQITRYRGPIAGGKAHLIDTVSANLQFENGSEHYTEIRQNDHLRRDLADLGGAWSEGEFGTLLNQTETLLGTQPVRFVRSEDLKGKLTTVFGFDVSTEESPWELDIDSQHYQVPFRTEVWVSSSTGQILKIVRTSPSLPPELHISEIQWTVALEATEFNGKQWLLPRTAEYEVRYNETGRREWNALEFSDYRRYSAESSIQFGALK